MLCWLTAVSKGSAEPWVCAGLQSSKAPVATAGGLAQETFLGSVLRGRLGERFGEAFCVLLEESAD